MVFIEGPEEVVEVIKNFKLSKEQVVNTPLLLLPFIPKAYTSPGREEVIVKDESIEGVEGAGEEAIKDSRVI